MVTTLTGTNHYKIAEQLRLLKTDFVKQFGNEGVEQYEAQSLQKSELGNLLGGVSLFAQQRFLIIKDLASNKELAEEFVKRIQQIPEEITVILVEGQLDKRTQLYKALKAHSDFNEYSELDVMAAEKWAKQYVEGSGGVIGTSEARQLVEHVGVDQSRLANEIDKLIAYSNTVTTNAIEKLVEKAPKDSVFDLLDAALQGRSAQALELLNSMERAHEDVFQIVNMLIWQTHIIAVIHSAQSVSDGEVAKQAKINPYVVQKTRRLANSLNNEKLNNIINIVAQCDVQLKTTSSDPWRVLEQAILKF